MTVFSQVAVPGSSLSEYALIGTWAEHLSSGLLRGVKVLPDSKLVGDSAMPGIMGIRTNGMNSDRLTGNSSANLQ